MVVAVSVAVAVVVVFSEDFYLFDFCLQGGFQGSDGTGSGKPIPSAEGAPRSGFRE